MAEKKPTATTRLKPERIQGKLKSERVQDQLRPERLGAQLKSERVQSRLKPERVQNRLRPERIHAQLEELPGWELAGDGQALERTYLFPTLRAAVAFVALAAELVTTVTTAFERDVLGRALAATTSSGERRTMTYDRGSADLLRTRTGAGTEEAVSRDGRGLPVFVSRPPGRGADRFAYDIDGLPLAQVTAAEDGTAL